MEGLEKKLDYHIGVDEELLDATMKDMFKKNNWPINGRFKWIKAFSLFVNQRLDESIKVFESVEELNEYSELLTTLAWIYHENHNYDKAIDVLERAVAINNFDQKPSWYNFDDFDNKKSHSKKEEIPRLATAFSRLALSYSSLNERNKSIEYYLKGLEIAPSHYPFMTGIAINYALKGDFASAEFWIQKGLAIAPESYEVKFSQVEYNIEKNNLDDAFKYLIDILKIRNSNIPDYAHNDSHIRTSYNLIYEKRYSQCMNSGVLLDSIIDNIKKNNAENYAAIPAFIFLEKLGEQIRGKELSEKFIQLIKTDKNIFGDEKKSFLGLMTGSRRRKVFTTGSHENRILKNNYILKLARKGLFSKEDSELLKKEYCTNLWLYTNISGFINELFPGKNLPVVPKNLLFLDDNKQSLLISESMPFYNIEEYTTAVSRNKDFVNLEDRKNQYQYGALVNLVLIHAIGTKNLLMNNSGYYFNIADADNNSYTVKLNSPNYYNTLMTRAFNGRKSDLNDRLGKNSSFKPFHDALMKVLRENDLRYFIHNDSYPHNVLTNGTWVDFENIGVGDPIMDVIKLSHNHIIYKESVIDDYINLLKSTVQACDFKIPITHYDIMESSYKRNILYDNLCQLGTMLACNNIENAKFYLEKSLGRMDGKLKDTFVAYIKATKHEELKKIL